MEVLRTTSGSETWLRPGFLSSADIVYLVTGVTTRLEAIKAVYEAKPNIYNNLYYSEMRVDEYTGDYSMKVTCVYKQSSVSDDAEDDEATISYEFSTSTMRMTHALSQRHIFGNRDVGYSINWNGKYGNDMAVEGIDVPVGRGRMVITKPFSRSKLTTAYCRKIATFNTHVNSKQYNGWERGELLFKGASYTAPLSGASKVVVTFTFDIQMNENNKLVAGINSGRVEGWEAPWVIQSTCMINGVPQSYVSDLNIAQTNAYADFNELGIL